jgi:glycoside/pentoside/hexuronide:cation symporter, GPH family
MQDRQFSPLPSVDPDGVALADRVPIGQKIAYGLGTANDMWGNWLYPGLYWPVYNMFLLVSPSLVSLAVMLGRLVDAISDPLFGWLSDNTRTRWGRRRPYILFGSIASGCLLPLLFMVSPGWSERTYFWYMVVSSGIFIAVVSSFNMPYQSLGTELTPDYHERTSVFAFKGAMQKLPEVAMFFAAAFISLRLFNDPKLGGKPNMLRGAQVYTTILGAAMIVVGIIVFAVVRERYYHKVVETHQERVSVTDAIWKTLRCRPFRAQLFMALAYGMGTSMVGALGYYATVYYVCAGDVALGSKWNFAMGLANLAFGFLGVPVFAFIAHRVGKRYAMMCVQISAILAFIGTWWFYNPAIPGLQLLASGFISFTGAGFWMLYGSIGADIIDYDELESGKRREGAFAACSSYLLKVGLALGMGVPGLILEGAGFDAKLAGAQPPHAIFMIRACLAGVPIAGLVVALVALVWVGLTQAKMMEIRQQLEARRGKV